MAQKVAELEVVVSLTTAQLQAAATAAQGAMSKVAGATGALDTALQKNVANLAANANAQDALRVLGITTTQGYMQQIAAIDALIAKMGTDAAVTGQLIAKKSMLSAEMTRANMVAKQFGQGMGASSNAMGSASFAVISLGQGFQDAGQFGMGMAQGIRAVTNNLQMSVQAMMMLTTQAGSAKAAMAAFWTAMKGPAGFLLAFGAITAAIEAIANASQGATKETNALADAIGDVISIKDRLDTEGVDGFVVSVGDARRMLAEASRETSNWADAFSRLRDSWFSMFGMPEKPQAPGLSPEQLEAARIALEKMIGTFEEGSEGFEVIRQLAARLGIRLEEVRKPIKEVETALKKFNKETAASAAVYELFLSALLEEAPLASITTWAAVSSDRIAELFGEIRRGTALAADVGALADEVERLMRMQSGNAGWGMRAVDLLGGKQMTAKPPKEREMSKSLLQARDGMVKLNEEARKVQFALADGINSELKQTQILLNTMPLSVIDNLSGAIGESVGQILTLQGGLKDVWDNILSSIRNIIAEMATLIVKQEILNAVTGKGKFGESLKGLGGMTGLGALGTAGLALGGLGLLTTILSGSRNYSANSQNTTLYGGGSPNRRMAVEGVVLRSGDIEFSVSERRAVNARIGR